MSTHDFTTDAQPHPAWCIGPEYCTGTVGEETMHAGEFLVFEDEAGCEIDAKIMSYQPDGHPARFDLTFAPCIDGEPVGNMLLIPAESLPLFLQVLAQVLLSRTVQTAQPVGWCPTLIGADVLVNLAKWPGNASEELVICQEENMVTIPADSAFDFLGFMTAMTRELFEATAHNE